MMAGQRKKTVDSPNGFNRELRMDGTSQPGFGWDPAASMTVGHKMALGEAHFGLALVFFVRPSCPQMAPRSTHQRNANVIQGSGSKTPILSSKLGTNCFVSIAASWSLVAPSSETRFPSHSHHPEPMPMTDVISYAYTMTQKS